MKGVIVSEEENMVWQGRDQIVANNKEILKDVTTVHHGHIGMVQ